MLSLIDQVNIIEEKKIEEKINKQSQKIAKLLQMQEQRMSKKVEKVQKLVCMSFYWVGKGQRND